MEYFTNGQIAALESRDFKQKCRRQYNRGIYSIHADLHKGHEASSGTMFFALKYNNKTVVGETTFESAIALYDERKMLDEADRRQIMDIYDNLGMLHEKS